MSDSIDCSERAGDAAAYVLGALDADEAAAFQRHTESCVVCRDELDEFGQVVDLLAVVPPQYEAPRRLRRAVMKQIRTTQAATNESAEPRRRRASDRRASDRRAPGWFSGLGFPGGMSGALAGGLATVALVVAGVAVVGSSGSTPTRTVPAAVQGLPGTMASLRVTGSHADLVVEHLPQPGAGRIYELWTEHGKHGQPQPTKELFAPYKGDAVVEVPGGVKSVDEVLVTSEPSGGSPHPTGTPIIVAPVS